MLSLDRPTILFHGSSVLVDEPDLSRCKPRKDFGRGFYLTSSRTQAISFSRTVTRRLNQRNPSDARKYGKLSIYEFVPNEKLQVRTYKTADENWLRCVAAHRGARAFASVVQELARFDVIVGKVANDQTNATLLTYLSGLYGELGSKEADEACIRLLLPNRLHDQVCLRTPKAIACLRFVESENVWL